MTKIRIMLDKKDKRIDKWFAGLAVDGRWREGDRKHFSFTKVGADVGNKRIIYPLVLSWNKTTPSWSIKHAQSAQIFLKRKESFVWMMQKHIQLDIQFRF